MRYALAVTATLLAAPLLAACTENADPDSGSGGDDARSLTVDSSDDACTLSAKTAPAGTLTFEVSNSGSKETEFYLLDADGKTVVGEVEDIGPGLSRKLTVSAEAGKYVAACKPGMTGDGIREDFTVT
jgi:iron uptake system component EfeO